VVFKKKPTYNELTYSEQKKLNDEKWDEIAKGKTDIVFEQKQNLYKD